MTIAWLKCVTVIMFLLVLGGCTILKRSQPTDVEIIDPLPSNRADRWQEQIDEGNWAFQNREFDRALQAYQTAMAIKPNSSEGPTKNLPKSTFNAKNTNTHATLLLGC